MQESQDGICGKAKTTPSYRRYIRGIKKEKVRSLLCSSVCNFWTESHVYTQGAGLGVEHEIFLLPFDTTSRLPGWTIIVKVGTIPIARVKVGKDVSQITGVCVRVCARAMYCAHWFSHSLFFLLFAMSVLLASPCSPLCLTLAFTPHALRFTTDLRHEKIKKQVDATQCSCE